MAERLSDKMQIMMVPMDGRNFFASDVLRSFGSLSAPAPPPLVPTEEEISEPAAYRKRTAKR